MLKKVFFIRLLLVLCLGTHSSHASDLNEYVSNLGEMALAPAALKTIFDEINAADTANSTNIAKLANAISKIKERKIILKNQRILRDRNPYLSIEYMKKTDVKLRELRSTHYKNIQYNNRWATHISEIVGTPLETISVLTSAYALVTRDYKKLSPVESVALGIQDGLSLGVGVANISQMVYNKVPTRAYAKFLSQNPVSKNLLKASKTSAASVLGTVILGAQIESAIYKHYRDEVITEIKDNIFNMSISQKKSRNALVEKLAKLLMEHYFNETPILYNEIISILQNHTVLHPQYGKIRTGQTIVLFREFQDFSKDGATYLADNYNKNTFSALTNEEKVFTALDAIAYMATLEDGEVYEYLRETVDNGAKLADIIFGALEGSSIYEIYNTTDLKNKMFPYLLMDDDSAYHFYGDIYKLIVGGTLAEAELKKRAEAGKILADLRKKIELQHQEDLGKIVFEVPQDSTASYNILQADAGSKITFYPYLNGNSLRECAEIPYDTNNLRQFWDDNDVLMTLNEDTAQYRLWYYDADGSKSVVLEYDHISGKFSFTMPAGEIRMTQLDIVHKDYARYNIGCGLPDQRESWVYEKGGEGTIIVDNNETNTGENNSSINQCEDNPNDIGCRVGMIELGHLEAKIDSNHGSYYDMALYNGYAYLARDSWLSIVDVSDPNNPTFVKEQLKEFRVRKILTIKDHYAFVLLDDYHTLAILNLSDPTQPVEINRMEHDNFKPQIVGDTLYDEENGIIKRYDISNPENISTLNDIELIKPYSNDNNITHVYKVFIKDNYVYVSGQDSDNDQAFFVYQIEEGATPVYISSLKIEGTYAMDNRNMNIMISNKLYYTANDSNPDEVDRILVIDVSNKNAPTFQYIHKDIGVLKSYNNKLLSLNRRGLEVINPETLTSINNLGLLNGGSTGYGIYGHYAYLYGGNTITVVDIIDTGIPNWVTYSERSDKINIDGKTFIYKILYNHYGYIWDDGELKIYDISNAESPSLVYSMSSLGVSIQTANNYAYILKKGDNSTEIYDATNPTNIVLSQTIPSSERIQLLNNYAYVGNENPKIYDISQSDTLLYVTQLDMRWINEQKIIDNYWFVGHGDGYLSIYDVSNPLTPVLLNKTIRHLTGMWLDNLKIINDNYLIIEGFKKFQIFTFNSGNPEFLAEFNMDDIMNIEGDGKNISVVDGGSLFTFNIEKAIEVYNLFDHTKSITLVKENYVDGTVVTEDFTKEWVFSRNIYNMNIEVISNTYANSIESSSFTKDGNKLSVALEPNRAIPNNKLVLKFTENYHPVKISGSSVFWSNTKTNHAPRLVDGQIFQMVSATNEPAFLTLETYDEDGDNVILSVEDTAGGYVDFDPDNANRLFASFSDGKVAHTIKIGLDDGKEKVIKELNVLQFDQTSIDTFYSDVDKNANAYVYDGIAFGTLKGVIWGQPDPNDTTKRIFRPTDEVSLAEALKIIVKAEYKAGLIELNSTREYYDIYPKWAMPYYTFALEKGAIEEETNLAVLHPTREEIAKIIVKTLGLEEKVRNIDINESFTDSNTFGSDTLLYNAKIVKYLGLFMENSEARPVGHITRAELALVIEKIFMIPHAQLVLEPNSGEFGESLTYHVDNIKAEAIRNTDYTLYDNASSVETTLLIDSQGITANHIDNTFINREQNSVYALIDNNGIKNIIYAEYHLRYTDKDKDGLQDSEDKWEDDVRYKFDYNNNLIPDRLDREYNLSSYSINDSIVVEGQTIKISNIVRIGGILLGEDTDDDGYPDANDTFPNDPNEWIDSDSDGIGNNADLDDDNDGLTDEEEVSNGLNPLDASDALADNDADGVSNIEEIKAGTDINNASSFPDALTLVLNMEVEDNVEQGSFKYYKLHALVNQKLSINLSNLSADLDLYVKKGEKPTSSSYDCSSASGGQSSEECFVDISEETDIYIGVYGYAEGNYSLVVKDGNIDTDNDGILDGEDIDDDNDGITDYSEKRYGLDPLDASDAKKDADNDGYSNAAEILANKNPNDANEFPTITTLVLDEMISGVANRSYYTYYKISVLEGKAIRIVFTNQSVGEDMYLDVKMGETPKYGISDCKITAGMGEVKTCSLLATETLDIYIGVYGVPWEHNERFFLKVMLEIDTDNDGILDSEDDDDDNDGHNDGVDDFPLNANEWLDTDHDGTGNNADKDDDNDGISDADERKWGFDPLDASDGGNADTDGDGVSNVDEIEAGSNPLDPDDTKKPKRFVPIMMDDLMVMVPLN